MNILITGAKGFIGKNLVFQLRNLKYDSIFEYDIDSSESELEEYIRDAHFIFHLAGVNRPSNDDEFMKGNYGLTSTLLEKLKLYKNYCPIVLSSSIQAEMNNPYGLSKKAGEDLLFNYSKETGAKVLIYRFSNVFGKWCRPNYNSVVATFSHNIAYDLPIKINDPNVEINLIYIDDLVNELINALNGQEHRNGIFYSVEPVYQVSLQEIVNLLYSFKNGRNTNNIPNLNDEFTKKLYSSFLSYLPKNKLSYYLNSNIDNRGSFTEFIKTSDSGQFSINISNPGITKGNHWHNLKTEKFLVVSGQGVIRLRQINSTEIIEFYVSENILTVVDIPPGYTHNIENLGTTILVTVIWANEKYDVSNPDTYFMEV